MSTKVVPSVSVHLVTFATHQADGLTVLVERTKKNGFIVQVIGMGTQWRGFGARLKAYYQQVIKMLQNGAKGERGPDACGPTDLVVLVDGYDVIPLGTPVEVVDAFQRHNTDVLVSSEANCVPYMLPPGQDPFKLYLPHIDHPFLNAGGVVGRADAVSYYLGDIILTRNIQDNDDDQAAMTQYYLHHLAIHKERREKGGLAPISGADHAIVVVMEKSKDWDTELQQPKSDLDLAASASEVSSAKKPSRALKLALDVRCLIFQCSIFDESVLKPRPKLGSHGRYLNTRTNTHPVFMHLPGKAAMLLFHRVIECKSLYDPRELLECICKGVSTKPKEPQEEKSGKAKDPIEKLEEFVIEYGEECSGHIATGMRVHNNRIAPALVPPTPSTTAPTSHSKSGTSEEPQSPTFMEKVTEKVSHAIKQPA